MTDTHTSPVTALLPCPFCGSAPAFSKNKIDFVDCVGVYCSGCDAEMPAREAEYEPEASARWNIRNASAQLPASPVTADLRNLLGAFRKTASVMKAVRNSYNKLMNVWPDDMKSVEDVLFFLENLQDSRPAQQTPSQSDILDALIALYSVAHVVRDEDYAAVTNAAAIIEKFSALPSTPSAPGGQTLLPSESGRASVKADQIVIPIDIAALPVIVKGAADTNNWDGEYTVTDPAVFAKELVYLLNSEDERGTTLIHRMFDRAILNAVEYGAEGIELSAVTSTECRHLRRTGGGSVDSKGNVTQYWQCSDCGASGSGSGSTLTTADGGGK